MKAKIVIIAVLTFIGLAVLGSFVFGPNNHGGREASTPAPSSTLLKPTSANELIATIKSLNSPLVLVNFWASWCEPCKKEFPSILSVREKFKDKGFKVVFVSIDEPADFHAAEEFLKEHHVDFQTYYKGYERLSIVNALYPKWEGAVPTSLLVNSNQQVVDAWEGDATQEEFEKHVLEHLRGT